MRSIFAFLLATLCLLSAAELTAQRAPADGLQPQAVIAPDGRVHLIYYAGAADAGDIFYVTRAPGSTDFSAPIRVDSEPGSAIAMGTIRGAQVALGRDGWVHVAWNGSKQATPKGPKNSEPMLYTRKAANAAAFEPQRNLITWAEGLDGGGSVAADGEGHVYVTWHASAGATNDGQRIVCVSTSRDDGKIFAKEIAPIESKTGVCACCSMRAGSDTAGGLAMLYRAAIGGMQRDMMLAYTPKPGAPTRIIDLEPWKLGACPMSSAAIARTGDDLLVAWQGEKGLRWTTVTNGKAGKSIELSTGEKAKHPTLARAADGTIAVVWTEGTGWNQGGSLHWQLYDASGAPQGPSGSQAGVPVWSIPTVIADGESHFSVWY